MAIEFVDDIFPTTRANMNANVRGYNFTDEVRTAIGAASSAAVAIPPIGQSREIMLLASTRCYVRLGDAAVLPASSAAGQLILEAGERFHLRLKTTETHYTVIRDSADGTLSVTPVA
ncbi:MAG: hypothetical protein RLZZ157_89 [Pseudomonadota bacterium]